MEVITGTRSWDSKDDMVSKKRPTRKDCKLESIKRPLYQQHCRFGSIRLDEANETTNIRNGLERAVVTKWCQGSG